MLLVVVAVVVHAAVRPRAGTRAGWVLHVGHVASVLACLDPTAQGCDALGRLHPTTGLLVAPDREQVGQHVGLGVDLLRPPLIRAFTRRRLFLCCASVIPGTGRTRARRLGTSAHPRVAGLPAAFAGQVRGGSSGASASAASSQVVDSGAVGPLVTTARRPWRVARHPPQVPRPFEGGPARTGTAEVAATNAVGKSAAAGTEVQAAHFSHLVILSDTRAWTPPTEPAEGLP